MTICNHSNHKVKAMKEKISYTKPSITELEIEYANDAVRNGWGESCYDYIIKFENLFKDYIGASYAVSTSSCTGALHMGLAALGVGIGDEVILADTNWIATAAPIRYLGATPVFVDIQTDSWCLSPESVEAAITNRTKAIIAVHIYGNMCDMRRLLEIGRKYNIPVVEDAAEAIGSIYFGQKAGSMGEFSTFSFHGTKTLTTGEGGMFLTNNKDLYERVLTLSNHGRNRLQEKQFWPDELGYKYKLSNIQAAIGCGQVERIIELVDRKKEILEIYRKELGNFEYIKLNPTSDNVELGAWMPTVVFDKDTAISRDKILNNFKLENIDARVFFYPLSSLPIFKACPGNVHAYDIPERAINLPSYHDMTLEDQMRVIDVVKSL